MDMWGNVLRILKVYMDGNGIGKRNTEGRRLLELSDEKSCAWQMPGFIRQTKGKSLIVPVDVKQKLVYACGRKIQKVCKGCESDFTGTSAQAGGRGSGLKSSKKGYEKATHYKKRDLEVE